MNESETKHTPGPWTFDGEELVSDAEDWDVAYLARFMNPGYSSEANGYLLAAAPELLEACEASVAYLLRGEGAGWKACELAQAAIAKARGEGDVDG